MPNEFNFTINDVHKYEINGIPVDTGDIVTTVDGNPSQIIGQCRNVNTR